uniref:NUMOD1 domain protein n=1 Tax=Siphoviridae sp. ctuUw41 TaxID=2826503 RepID=A0A8S5MZG1_9CAUD|nr:MAG TPA: NUMOD1 domain protein [Siphoviridae sp. ctuUw41]
MRKYNHVFCFNKDKELVAEYINIPSASQATGVSQSIIVQELHKEIKTLSGNFYWSTSNKIDKIKNYTNTGKKKTVYQYDLKGKFINKYDSVG